MAVKAAKAAEAVTFCTKGVLKNFTKFRGEHFCWSPFFNKIAGPQRQIYFKKRLRPRCFPVNFEKSLRAPIL